MEANNKIIDRIDSEAEGISFNLIKAKFLKNWIWFACFSFVGVAIAVVYNKLALPYYRISTTILVQSDTKGLDLNNIFSQLKTSQGYPEIQDQIGVLKSYSLNLQTMQYFNWRYSWYKQELIARRDLYKREPFLLDMPNEAIQLENVPIHITPKGNKYSIECDEKVSIDGAPQKVSFKLDATFGQPFKNKYFQFTISKKEGLQLQDGDEYVLIFNDLSKLALAYKERLEVRSSNAMSDSHLIIVELVTNQLGRDVDYLNELGKIYIQFGLDEKNRVANNTIKFIDSQIAGVNSTLQSAGDRFSSFRAQNKTVDLGQEAAKVVEQLQQIEKDRADLDLRIDYYNNLKFYLDNRGQNKDLVAPSIAKLTDEALNAMVKKLNDLYSKREVMSYTVQERNPVLISLNNEIDFTQKSLRENIDNLISNATVEAQTLNERQQRINAQLSKLPKTEQDLIGIKRNFDLNNELYTFLLQRRAEAEITKASNNPDGQILDPTDRGIALLLGPILAINIVVGLFGGLFIALVIVVVRELMSEKLGELEDISRRLDVSIVGSVVFSRYKTEMPVFEFPRSALAESFRGIRGNIEFLSKDSENKVLAVHSYISGEGKSFVAFNLALIFAMTNKKTLIVDGDLRKPRLHTIVGQDNSIGLSTFLDGKAKLEDVIRETKIPNLSFVSSGDVHESPAELLNSSMIKTFVESVRQQFDFVIIDNSPIGLVYDATLIGAQADFNLILLRLNYSNKSEISAINKIGYDAILKNVMVAVNDIRQVKGYGYYAEESKAQDGKLKLKSLLSTSGR